ncbi:hypothetical protein GCM10007907_27920 [Chitinimonas prasina]|uniref:Uncharacterized protein n=1 Tax=Chitinimonas prasina TaxID=1434937 RepID=A0ABQ5YHL7_9NEIS|nr:hypothetical protein [Chitinimonas prasina]GLR14002.1 hypothetical protein GCM10007907_27920 [Chitinimonas prasina]
MDERTGTVHVAVFPGGGVEANVPVFMVRAADWCIKRYPCAPQQEAIALAAAQ